MYSVLKSYGLNGLNGFAVAVEADVSGGLPAFSLVGLPDSAVRESGDRVRSAVKNLGYKWPDRHITVNLAPADIRKSGPVYDLPLLLAVLASSGQMEEPPADAAFLGELALDGSLRPVSGVLPMALAAAADGIRSLYVPAENAAEAAVAGVARPCDIGVFNDRFFVYVAAFGAFTDVSYDTPQPFKNTFGHLAYLLEGATKLGSLLKGYHLTIEHDGGAVEGDFIYGMVSNTISVGGFQLFPPERVALDDGLFEVVLVRLPRNPAEFQSALRSLTRQNTVESDMIVALHTSRLRVVTQEELTWTLDGEYGGAPETVEIQNRQKALTLIWGK